ncbi:MAG TPA: hypothetical protein PLQ00_10120, partial [Thermoguttaceae bacterium]|nr:hypothetical protein [Thermoguttaceae bacterium]
MIKFSLFPCVKLPTSAGCGDINSPLPWRERRKSHPRPLRERVAERSRGRVRGHTHPRPSAGEGGRADQARPG